MTSIADEQQRREFASRLAESINAGDHVAVETLLGGASKDMVETLLHEDDHETPLFVAAKRGKHGVVDLLLELGADARAVNRRGWTPLMVSLGSWSLEIVEMLLELKEVRQDLEASNRLGDTALMIAAHLGFFEATRALLDAGARTRTMNRRGYRAVHFAAANGHAKVLGLLLSRKADAKALCWLGRSPLMVAVRAERAETIDALCLAHRKLIELPDRSGKTPLMHALERENGSLAVVETLIKVGGARRYNIPDHAKLKHRRHFLPETARSRRQGKGQARIHPDQLSSVQQECVERGD